MTGQWAEHDSQLVYRLPVRVIEWHNIMAACSLTLPGEVGFGATIDEALANVQRSLEKLICEYLDAGLEPPWSRWNPRDDGIERCVIVRIPRQGATS